MEKKETGGHCIEVEIMKKKTSSGIDFEAVRNTCDSIRKEIGKVVVGIVFNLPRIYCHLIL